MANVGTSLAPIEQIRKYHMLALFNDLFAIEDKGLTNEECKLVQAALASLANAAAEIPDGTFYGRTILDETEALFSAYIHWNDIEGTDRRAAKKRGAALSYLRKRRQRLAKRIHINQFVLQSDLDTRLVEDMYTAFANVVKGAPKIFEHLAKAAIR